MLEIILNLNLYINDLINLLGIWFYIALFLIILCETGIVLGILLPGDSLLFALGVASAVTELNIHCVVLTVFVGAICGDSCNYITGRFIGDKIFRKDAKILNTKYLRKTKRFFDKYGAKAIIFARFIAFVRTLAPFVAGISKMNYFKFITYGTISAAIWAVSIPYIAYLFSDNDFVKANLSLIILGIILITLIHQITKYIFYKKDINQQKP